jgi:hypothetical protein
LAKHRKTHLACRTTKPHQERPKEAASPFGVAKAGIMGDRLLVVGAVIFGVIIPITFVVIAWFNM